VRFVFLRYGLRYAQCIYVHKYRQTIGQRLTTSGRASRHLVLTRHAGNDAGVHNNGSTFALDAASNI